MRAITATLIVMMLTSCGPVLNSGKKICDGVSSIRSAATITTNSGCEDQEKKQPADQSVLLYRVLISL